MYLIFVWFDTYCISLTMRLAFYLYLLPMLLLVNLACFQKRWMFHLTKSTSRILPVLKIGRLFWNGPQGLVPMSLWLVRLVTTVFPLRAATVIQLTAIIIAVDKIVRSTLQIWPLCYSLSTPTSFPLLNNGPKKGNIQLWHRHKLLQFFSIQIFSSQMSSM